MTWKENIAAFFLYHLKYLRASDLKFQIENETTIYSHIQLSECFNRIIKFIRVRHNSSGHRYIDKQKHDMVEQKLNKKTLQLTLISCIGVIIVS